MDWAKRWEPNSRRAESRSEGDTETGVRDEGEGRKLGVRSRIVRGDKARETSVFVPQDSLLAAVWRTGVILLRPIAVLKGRISYTLSSYGIFLS